LLILRPKLKLSETLLGAGTTVYHLSTNKNLILKNDTPAKTNDTQNTYRSKGVLYVASSLEGLKYMTMGGGSDSGFQNKKSWYLYSMQTAKPLDIFKSTDKQDLQKLKKWISTYGSDDANWRIDDSFFAAIEKHASYERIEAIADILFKMNYDGFFIQENVFVQSYGIFKPKDKLKITAVTPFTATNSTDDDPKVRMWLNKQKGLQPSKPSETKPALELLVKLIGNPKDYINKGKNILLAEFVKNIGSSKENPIIGVIVYSIKISKIARSKINSCKIIGSNLILDNSKVPLKQIQKITYNKIPPVVTTYTLQMPYAYITIVLAK